MSGFDTDNTRYPACPHCGHVHEDCWKWDFGPMLEGEWKGECGACGKEFSASRRVEVTYTSRIPKKTEGTTTTKMKGN